MTLRVRFEIVPHGIEEQTRAIGSLEIHNVKDLGFGFAEYDGVFLQSDGHAPVSFNGIAHRREDGFAHLTMMVLDHIGRVTGRPRLEVSRTRNQDPAAREEIGNRKTDPQDVPTPA